MEVKNTNLWKGQHHFWQERQTERKCAHTYSDMYLFNTVKAEKNTLLLLMMKG